MIPTTFAPVKKQDFTLTPIRVHKKYFKTQNTFSTTGSGHYLVEGWHSGLITPIGAAAANNDPVNNIDNSYKHIIWNSIDHLYYRNPYNPYESFEHNNRRYVFKQLNATASLMSIPYMEHGEQLRPKSIQIYNSASGLFLTDDGNGNLYDPEMETRLVAIPRHTIVGYWGFNSEFRNFKKTYGTKHSGNYKYDSWTFAPVNYPSKVSNVYYGPGAIISGSNCGLSAIFKRKGASPGWIQTPNNNQFNFDSTEDFTISFWFNPAGQTTTGSLISKNGVVFQNTYGVQPFVYSGTGQVTKTKFISSSFFDTPTSIYPFDFSYCNGNLTFRRSDGTRTVSLTAPVSSSAWNHVVVTRYDSDFDPKIKMFINGGEHEVQDVDKTNNPMNEYDLMFGSRNRLGLDAYSGSIDEIRISNSAFYSASILDIDFYHKLANPDYMFGTSVVGNVFYKKGNIVLSPLNNKYQDMFSGAYTVNYSGTHTIYQYEVLCRVRKGEFNLTLNPTALKSPKSDLLINDLTGSFMRPYATTIGMYSEKGELVAIGKLGQALMMRDDVDINILVRWDG